MLYDPVPVSLDAMQCVAHTYMCLPSEQQTSFVIAIIYYALDVFLWAVEISNNSRFLAIPPHVLPVLLAAPVLGKFGSDLIANASS